MSVPRCTVAVMQWTKPPQSKSAVNRAARTYLDASKTPEEREEALLVMDAWRSAHRFPLNTIQMSLRTRARKVDPDALVAQRIKRLPSIRAKLAANHNMEFSRMQDLGGCRAVVVDVDAVSRLVEITKDSRSAHELIRHDDYIQNPKVSGYRGHHLVYRYVGKDSTEWNGLATEIQIRSRKQHAWATAVETVGMFTSQALKSGLGDDRWLRFFQLMSSEIAHTEGCASIVPGTPEDRTQLRAEIRELAKSLDVMTRLQAFTYTLKNIEQRSVTSGHRYYLLELRVLGYETATLQIRGERRLREAQALYQAAERQAEAEGGVDVVLVTVDSAGALRRAYPNYYADTETFRGLLQKAIA